MRRFVFKGEQLSVYFGRHGWKSMVLRESLASRIHEAPKRLVSALLSSVRSVVFSADNLVLNTLQILEEKSVVARRSIFRILPWWTHYRGPYFLQFPMQSVDFGARFRFKGKMMECAW